MGLFRNDRRELEQALDSLRFNIGANDHHGAAVAEIPAVVESRARVGQEVQRLRGKGKESVVDEVFRSFGDTTPPLTALGRGAEAVAELERLEQVMANGEGENDVAPGRDGRPSEVARIGAAHAYWRQVLGELQAPARQA